MYKQKPDPAGAALDRIRNHPSASIPDVAAVFGIGVSTTYEAARHTWPTVQTAGRVQVPSAWVLAELRLDGNAA